MRRFTLKRRKSFVGSIATLKVYIEDSESGELTIKGFNCRKLGDIKNGKEETFYIPDEETRIFVIADKMSKDICVDMKKIPAGEDDVKAEGVCKFNPGIGNAFRFDGEADEETVAVRTGGAKKGKGIMVFSVILGLLIGFGVIFLPAYIRMTSPKDFKVEEMTITLNGKFQEYDIADFTGCYYTNDVDIYIVRDGFAEFFDEGTEYYDWFKGLTVEEYADIIVEVYEADVTFSSEKGLLLAEYDYIGEHNGKTYTSIVVFYKADDAFWTISFETLKTQAAEYRDDIIKWPQSVRFD